MSVDGLPNPKEKDLDFLRSTGRLRYSRLVIKAAAAVMGLLFGALVALYSVHRYQGENIDAAVVQEQLLSIRSVWADEFADSMERYRAWLGSHGTRTEAMLFDDVSVILAQSAMSVAASNDRGDGQMSFVSALYVSLHGGVMRLMFLILASLRLWIVTMVFAIAWGVNSFKPYRADDVLGQTGNGRLFYSGIRVGLDQLAPDGSPDMQVRGLACPDQVSIPDARKSLVWQILHEFGAVNPTNEVLTAILVKYSSYSPYVAAADEEGMLKGAFAGGALEENAAHLLTSALTLHGIYAAGDVFSSAGIDARSHTDSAQSSEEYALTVKAALHRVLIPELRQLIGALPAAEIATAVLAFECGKTLAHSYEGGRWIRKSNFPQLSARAVLHSVLEYPRDYSYEARNRIRRALIYASRRSSFAPVRMPIDLAEDTWALRQWMEVLLACPHELAAVTDEVEMVAIVRAAHHKWIQEFLDGSVAFTPEIARNSYSTPSDLLFVPLSRVIALLRKTIDPATIRRLEQLVSVVSTRQRFQILEAQNSDQGAPEGPTLERVFPLLSDEDIRNLAKIHNVPADELKDWSALRILLTSYGWLARRVGDYTVPESSVIFTVFKADAGHKEVNSLGLIGKAGMVPFRGSKLEERWGRNWSSRFMLVNGVTMAESTDDYEKLLAGIKEQHDDEPFESTAPATA